jgi:hypothetical protein
MSEPIRRKPQPGDSVRVGSLPDVFEVIEHQDATVMLQAPSGARCRAGINAVRFAHDQASPMRHLTDRSMT